MNVEIAPRIISGTLITVEIAGLAMILSTVLSVGLGLARLIAFRPVRWLVRSYVELFRGTSLLVQLFWMYYVLPHFGLTLDPFTVGVVGISLNSSAYGAESVRAAIMAVPRTQYEATTALNMAPWHRTRRIVLPQAFIMLLPPWGNMLIDIIKSTSVVSLISISDLSFEAYQLSALSFRTVEIFLIVLAIYFALAQTVAAGVRLIERRVRRGAPRGAL